MTGMVKDLVFYLLKIMLVAKFVTCALLVDNDDQLFSRQQWEDHEQRRNDVCCSFHAADRLTLGVI